MVDNPLKGYQAITFTFSIPIPIPKGEGEGEEEGEEEGDHLSSSPFIITLMK